MPSSCMRNVWRTFRNLRLLLMCTMPSSGGVYFVATSFSCTVSSRPFHTPFPLWYLSDSPCPPKAPCLLLNLRHHRWSTPPVSLRRPRPLFRSPMILLESRFPRRLRRCRWCWCPFHPVYRSRQTRLLMEVRHTCFVRLFSLNNTSLRWHTQVIAELC